MPDNDQPMWPAGDEDTSSRGGGATARFPIPKPGQTVTDRLAVPNVTAPAGSSPGSDERPPGSWFKPNVPPELVPGLNTPVEPRPAGDRGGQAGPLPQQGQPGQQGQSGRPSQQGHASQHGQAGQQSQPGQAGQMRQPGQPRQDFADRLGPRPGEQPRAQKSQNQQHQNQQAPGQQSQGERSQAEQGQGLFGQQGQGGRPEEGRQSQQEPGQQQSANALWGQPQGQPQQQQQAGSQQGLQQGTSQQQGQGHQGEQQGLWSQRLQLDRPEGQRPQGQPGQQQDGSEGQPPQGQPGQQPDRPEGQPLQGRQGAQQDGLEGQRPQGRPGAQQGSSEGQPPQDRQGAQQDRSEGQRSLGQNQQGQQGQEKSSSERSQQTPSDQSTQHLRVPPPAVPWVPVERPARPGDGDQSRGDQSRGDQSRGDQNRGDQNRGDQNRSDQNRSDQSRSEEPRRVGSMFEPAPVEPPKEEASEDSSTAGSENGTEYIDVSKWDVFRSEQERGEAQRRQPERQEPQRQNTDSPREERWDVFHTSQSANEPEGPRDAPQWDSLQNQGSRSQDNRDNLRGLPEPPRGAVPPASGMQARPVRIEPSGEQFPAEATVGIERPAEGFAGGYDDQDPPGGEPQRATPPEEPKAKKGKKKFVVLGLVVVLVLAAAGVASAMPQVSNRLGLPWAPNAPKGDSPDPASVTLALHGPETSGQGPSANGVASALAGPAGASALSQLTGSVIDPATGSVLWDHGSTTPLTPASTTKILTVSAALLSMDPTKRIVTKVVQGSSPGTVIIVGGGDPSLTALPIGTDSPLYPGAAHVDDLVAQIKKADPDVQKVQVDVSAYAGPTTAPGWEPGDAPSTYGAPIVPAMADGGRLNPSVDETPRSGNPATTLTQLVADKLGAQAAGTAKAPADAKVVAQVQSAPLPDLAYALLQISDNVLADALGRQVAITEGAQASFSGAAASVKKVLADHGFDVTGLQLSDTSGLSNQNKVPARLLAQVLAEAAAPDGKNPDTPKLRPLLAGLPVAGSPAGTLAARYATPNSAAGKGWVRAKTGTLTGVNTLAGYVLDSDNRVLAFAFMSNGSEKNPGQAALDVLATTLRKCGCN
ncbi:D-alanyl-D-alanine carboxypeptidase/D-alanyl-D-alanine-endopeptidase [Amycolatopsis sp. NPDC023774]|uniref:D-alanyl-D-alanine carboxypeptidase/D-alanyl-D-alanine endopeptidase n=1 Tax=Amycolatopsis sp. NPDC023774 TaxID=3155015 RepID=UPI0033F44D60